MGFCDITGCYGSCNKCLGSAMELGGRGAYRSRGDISEVFDGERWRILPDVSDELVLLELLDLAEAAKAYVRDARAHRTSKSIEDEHKAFGTMMGLFSVVDRFEQVMEESQQQGVI